MRRLTWSPDGLLLACPSGEINPPPVNKEDKDDIKSENVKMETNVDISNVKLESVDSKNEALPVSETFNHLDERETQVFHIKSFEE